MVLYVCSFPEKSIGGAKYIVSFIDDYSRKAFVYLMKNKDEVFNLFIDFKTYVERQTGKVLKAVVTDNGGEYLGRFENYLKENGIRHTKTVPYTPHQNSVSEVFNRVIAEKVHVPC